MAFNGQFIPAPQFADRLQEGERLLWEGRPDASQFNRPRVIVYALMLLPTMPLCVWAFAHKFGASLPLLSPLTFAIGFGLWPLACWVMSCYVGEQTKWAAYAVTDQRIMIRRLQRLTSQNSRPQIDEYPLTMVTPRLSQLRMGAGTITFGFSFWNYEQAFRAIPEARRVFEILSEASAALAPSDRETPYYLPKTDSQLPALKIEAYLQRGETVLWQGSMDTQAYWRTQRTAIIVLHLLIPATIGTFLVATNQWTPLWQVLAILPALIAFLIWKAWVLRTPSRFRYVLTNQRVLILKKQKRGQWTLEERSLVETAQMRLINEKSGFGTIVFERQSHWVWHGHGVSKETYEYSFQHIAEAQMVYAQITTAQVKHTNIKTLPLKLPAK